jgi:pectinesterase
LSATGFMFATNSSLVGAIAVPSNGTANPFTTTLCGLAANTNYWAIAYATNAAGTSYGDTITFTTLEFLCGTS